MNNLKDFYDQQIKSKFSPDFEELTREQRKKLSQTVSYEAYAYIKELDAGMESFKRRP